jgi:CrcB protein
MRTGSRLYAAVALGSALGAVTRYLCSLAVVALAGTVFPWATLLVNVVGSFLIGLFAAVTAPDGRFLVGPAARQFVMAGFCGGFTTFSVFSLETLLLIDGNRFGLAVLYVGASLLLWLFAVWLGHALGARFNRLRGV